MPSAQPPVRRSYSGSISRAATFQLPARAESWATSMSKKKKLKLKIVRVSSYQIQFDEMEDWLATRYDKIIKTEMNLKEVCHKRHRF
jgi:hypothetical protein